MSKENTKTENTIIIGAGISGLGCARTLFENKKSFKIITENIGGRILQSKDNTINYGAYYIAKDYLHVKKYVKLGKRLSIFGSRFNKGNQSYSIFNKNSIKEIPQSIKLLWVLIKFKKHYEQFKKKCEQTPQAKALKQDPFLFKLYNKRATDFVKETRITEITQNYLTPALQATTFLPTNKLRAFEFLRFTLPLIIPIYEFHFLKDKITKGFEKNIIINRAEKIRKHQTGYEITTKNNKKYYANNLVIATPPEQSFKLLNLPPRQGVNAHMFHIKGEIKEHWKKGTTNFFDNNSNILVIAKQKNQTYLLYSKNNNPKLSDYFKKYTIIAHKFWNPAFILTHKNLINSQINNNIYLIGDYNICGLEDSYITGIFAANKIIQKQK